MPGRTFRIKRIERNWRPTLSAFFFLKEVRKVKAYTTGRA